MFDSIPWNGNALVFFTFSKLYIKRVIWVGLFLLEIGFISICQVNDSRISYMLRTIQQKTFVFGNITFIDETFS